MPAGDYNLFHMAQDEFDVVVVGSGAAGMTAAMAAAHAGLRTVVIEKAPCFGGSTARSGGGVWIPNNEALRADGVRDTPEAARDYLHSIIGDVVQAERIDAYLERGPEALSFVQRHSPLRMRWVPDYSDYYPEAPGGRVGGRSVEPTPFNGKKLGRELANLEPDYGRAPLNVSVTQADYRWLNLIMRHPRGPLRVLRVGSRWLWAMLTGKRLLVRGQALAAGLRLGLQRAGVPLLLDTGLVDLHSEGGVVTGVVVQQDGATRLLRARHGVILASGGFEHNAELRQKYQRAPITTEWTVGAKANTGDGILAGAKLGAALDLMDDAWWGPSIPLSGGPWFCLAERTLPGGIMVNDRGERFMNEAAPYVEAVHRMYGGEYGRGDGPPENIPAWMVIDQRYRNRYVFAGLLPRQKFPGRWYKAGALVKGDTIAELAGKMGVPADRLAATVERFNGFARTGKDEDFGRGESGYDRYYGDPHVKPNPSLAPIEQGPFYAVTMVPGDLGTKGGLRTDVAGRVLREDGSVIEGLYAAGNTSAPVMGHTYAGPGATIGPAITFGYLAALDIAQRATAHAGGERTAVPSGGAEPTRAQDAASEELDSAH
jgi:3-oxosteroid 1-dehydrogenase